MIDFSQTYHNTEVYIADSIFQSLERIELIAINFFLHCSGNSLVTIEGCLFMNNSGVSQSNSGMITVSYPWHDNSINNVLIVDCNFVNNTAYHTPAFIIKLYLLISQMENPWFTISNCSFVMNSNYSVLIIPHSAVADMLNKIIVSVSSSPLFKILLSIIIVVTLIVPFLCGYHYSNKLIQYLYKLEVAQIGLL